MTFPESEFYSSYEECMREDKLIPVFPLSQPSLEDFMREDKLPPVFPSSQPSIEDFMREDKQLTTSIIFPSSQPSVEEYMRDDKFPLVFPSSLPTISIEDLLKEDNLPLNPETQVYSHHFISEICDPLWSSPSSSPGPSLSPSSSPGPSPSPSPSTSSSSSSSSSLSTSTSSGSCLDASPCPSTSSITSPSPALEVNNSVISVNSEDTNVKQPATRGRKRKLFTNCEAKKKTQNKEAARRYREKKKSEDSRLEVEEAQLIEKQKSLRIELDSITRTHREFLLLAKDFLAENRRKKRDLAIELNQLLESFN